MTQKSNNTQLAETRKKDISAQVLSKIEAFKQSGELRVPKDYSPENALKSAYIILSETTNKQGQKALDHCTGESIANSLLKMVVWGLSPLKKQCDFIMYGNKLECSPEYTGNIALAKRYGGLKNIIANVIYKGDDFEFEIDPGTGRRKVIKHKQTLSSIGNEILGAYATIEMVDGSIDVEVMTMAQIRASWNQGAANGNSPAHKNFADQMAKKTVINRACKLLIRASDDSILYNKEEDEETIDVVAEDVKHEIQENANKQEVGFDDVDDVEVVSEEVKAEEKEQQTNPVDNGQPQMDF